MRDEEHEDRGRESVRKQGKPKTIYCRKNSHTGRWQK